MAASGAGVTGLVLAGGEGRRMGGADKGLLMFRQRPLVCHAADRLRPQVDALLLSANRNLDSYRALGLEPLCDTVSDNPRTAGPLAGVLTGLETCRTDWLVTVPCDAPALPDDLVARLLAAARAADARAAFAVTGNGPHPVFMLLGHELTHRLGDFLRRGGRRVRDWQDEVGAAAADFPDAAAFANINTPEDLSHEP